MSTDQCLCGHGKYLHKNIARTGNCEGRFGGGEGEDCRCDLYRPGVVEPGPTETAQALKERYWREGAEAVLAIQEAHKAIAERRPMDADKVRRDAAGFVDALAGRQ